MNNKKINFEETFAPEPYPYLTGSPTGSSNTLSPDPTINWQWDNPKASDDLEIYTLKPVEISTDNETSFSGLSGLKDNSTPVKVTGSGSIMLDFGQVSAGWLEFDSKDLSGSVLMSISEYREPAILNKGAQNRIKTRKPKKYGNTYRLELNRELYEGVRFGWIHVENLKKDWNIDKVRLVCQVKPTNYRGSFSCDNSELTQIWYTGVYGVRITLQKEYFGSILMERSDRHSWTGDAYLTQAAALPSFANYSFIKKNLKHTSTQSNGIESYSLYWVLSLIDYFNYSGDIETVESYIDNASNKLDHSYKIYGTNPKLVFYGWDERIGAGFFHINKRNSNIDAQFAFKMLSIQSWIEFAKLLEVIDQKDLSRKYKDYATEKLGELRRDPNWIDSVGLHGATDAINTGLLSDNEIESIYNRCFTDRQNRLSFSPFNQFFVIEALAKMERHDLALETIFDHWGGQLKYGATTFFETFRPSWNDALGNNAAPPNGQCGYTSLAHPWGGGVVKWISEEILGVVPVSPGFKTINIHSHLGAKLNKVKGVVPTPNGDIEVDIDITVGMANYTIPKGSTANIRIPTNGKDIVKIEFEDRTIWEVNGLMDPAFTFVEGKKQLELHKLQAGKYHFRVSYSGERARSEESTLLYPAEFIGSDTTTRENWSHKYGKKGHMLFNTKRSLFKLRHDKVLTKDIIDIHLGLNGNIIWKKGLGAIITKDPLPCLQTMTVDIEIAKNNESTFTLYFIDWDKKDRRTAIEVFDLKNKNLIAPVKVVEDFSSGIYMTFRYSKSIRFRINHVRGPNAVLSGIFID